MTTSLKLKVVLLLYTTLKDNQTFRSFLEETYEHNFRALRMIAHAMRFDFEVVPYTGGNTLLQNGSWTGAIGMLNRSEADMTPLAFIVTEERSEAVHFAYPFKFSSTTFIVKKPEHSPQIFGLVKALSLSVWITLAFFATAMIVLMFMVMKQKYSFTDVLLNVLATCLGKSSLIKPWTLSQEVLTWSWIVATMFLSFCYSSVLLSFLTFPSVLEIKDIQSLARAVEKNGYNCMFESYITGIPPLFPTSESKYLRRIGENLYSKSNPYGFGHFEDFFSLKKEKIAYFTLADFHPRVPKGYFVPRDNIFERIGGMSVRKDFCCKKKLDKTVNRIVAAGLYLKIEEDSAFRSGLKYQFEGSKETSERKLTLTDLFLPFMILLFGYVVSVIVLIAERTQASRRGHGGRKRKTNLGFKMQFLKNIS